MAPRLRTIVWSAAALLGACGGKTTDTESESGDIGRGGVTSNGGGIGASWAGQGGGGSSVRKGAGSDPKGGGTTDSAAGGDGAGGVMALGGSGALPPETDPSVPSDVPFRCTNVTCMPVQPPPTDCSGAPYVTDVSVSPFDVDGFDLRFRVLCAPLPADVHEVSAQAFIPSQGVWDTLYASDWRTIEITGEDGDWTYDLHATGIDETTLADIARCAGWYVALTILPEAGGSATCYALGDQVSVENCAGGGAVEADLVPFAIQCSTFAFGR